MSLQSEQAEESKAPETDVAYHHPQQEQLIPLQKIEINSTPIGKKRTIIFITITLVLLTIYLIITSKYRSLKLHKSITKTIPNIIGTDPFMN